MDPQQFLAEFGHIAGAPGGVSRLRDLVLALAVQGRLVPQLESEEPAARQLARIAAAAANRPISGRRRKALPASRFDGDTTPVPNGWARTRLCDLVRVLNGRAYSKQELLESGTPVLRVGNLFTSDHWYYSDLDLEADKYADTGDLLFAWSASFGPFVWEGGRVIFHYHIWKLDLFSHEDLNKRFLYTWLLEKTQEIKASGHGISMAHMTKERFEALEISLPPLEEQSRIVAKVDELMALCDQLEQQQKDRRKLQNALRQATLQAIATAQSPHELQMCWQRLQSNLRHLLTEPGDVQEVRRLVLALAANGHLSTRLTGDDDPSSLLEQSRSDQLAELSSRQMREVQALPEPVDQNGRLRVALGCVVKLLSGQHLAPDEYNTAREGVPYITGPAEFKDGKPLPTKWTKERRAVAVQGDILITVKGSGVGKTAICDIPELAISRQLMAVRALRGVDRSYLSICIDAAEQHFQSQKFGIAIPGIGRDEVLKLDVLLPSLAEQRRIVAAVAELMRRCDELEGNLQEAVRTAGRYAVSAVASLTGIAIKQDEDTAVKAPQTELIAPLRLATAPDVKAQAPLATILARHDGEMAARDLWQRFGGEIDAFYAQLKTEVARGWIAEPEPAQVREKPTAETAKA